MEVLAAGTDVAVGESTVVVGVMEGFQAADGSSDLFASVDARSLTVAGFEAKAGQMLAVPHDEAAALLLVGLGDEVSFESIRAASGAAARKVKTETAVTYLGLVEVEGAARAAIEGSMLGSYRFRRYKSEAEDGDDGPSTIHVVGAAEEEVFAASAVSRATALARDWGNTPAIDQAPEVLAEEFTAAAGDAGMESEVWDLARIRAEALGGLLGVAAGSDRDPRLVQLRYRPEGAQRHLVLVGKGITFDSGGLSLKTAAAMEEMKDDMSGAATVTAAAIGIAGLGLPVNVTTITPLTDNAVGGRATRPGDVLKPRRGPAIEVLNTDAEGRLILADGLALAQEMAPDLAVDVATLTGAARVALGDKIAAVFGSDRDVAAEILDAASAAGEEFWEMPLFAGYRKDLDSNIADIKNISGGRYGGAIVAALFLSEYAGDMRWAHLDIAGPARARETAGDTIKGSSGIGVRTLVELARSMV